MNNAWTERIAEQQTEIERLMGSTFPELIAKLKAENKRLREALDRIESMATIENTEIQKIAREALKEASHESK
jgi:molybdopterin converting factor small subunit